MYLPQMLEQARLLDVNVVGGSVLSKEHVELVHGPMFFRIAIVAIASSSSSAPLVGNLSPQCKSRFRASLFRASELSGKLLYLCHCLGASEVWRGSCKRIALQIGGCNFVAGMRQTKDEFENNTLK